MKHISCLLSWLLLLTGCTTTSRVDWTSRIGAYTYDQAVMELGPPKNVETLPDGARVATWLTQRGRPGSVGFGMGAAFATPGLLESPIPHETPATPDQYLRLTFGPDGRLVQWKQFYQYR
jgi:hypothetical protein